MTQRFRALIGAPILLLACTGGGGATGGPSEKPGTPVTPALVPSDAKAFSELKQRADAAGALDAKHALAAYPAKFREKLDYDPLTAQYLDRIQNSALALSASDQATLGKNGFVIAANREFPTFVRGLAEIYSEHLPVYVSADALFESVHSSYDNILLAVERATLIPDVHDLLTGMRARLSTSSEDARLRSDTDLYLAVALSLLDGTRASPVAGADAQQLQDLVSRATAANGTGSFTLFGTPRTEDFSQFTPRGHYTGDPALEAYFRAMMWLGRVDLRLIETDTDGSSVFRRSQYDATLLIYDLIEPDLEKWQQVDDTLRTFVGESDYMVVPEIAHLVADLGGADKARAASDEVVAKAIVVGGYGKQEIASHLMVNDGTVKTLPLNRSFLVFGQRYIVDSHVFSEVVYDRIGGRMMPNPLDAAFAALGNNQALALDPDVSTVPELSGALSRMRVLIDAHDDAFWDKNFYNLWLRSLRALSPLSDFTGADARGLPEVAGTEAWGRRILNAQLGSWAEVRHDTLLYAKQSYTGIPVCDFPDAYIDPYPEVFGAIRKYAEAGARIVTIATAASAELGTLVAGYFDSLRTTAAHLEHMAELERQGQSFSAEELAFINDAVRIDHESAGCTTIDVPNGWYAKLFFDPAKFIEFNPTIADVHTQPADEGGSPVGKVLHVGTGYPRMMVATVDTCGGAHAYAGVVFAYHEEITKNFKRLTDEEWAARFGGSGVRPAEVPWMAGLLSK